MRRRPVAAPALLVLLALLAGCRHRPPPPPPAPPIRYILEPAWQAGGTWYYPHESFSLDQTGVAAVIPAGHPALTTDNERYDPAAMAAAMQAVQLPAIATVTNLETGRQLTLRVNDRGPPDPGRLIAVTPRVAALLGFAGPVAQVRVQFDPRLSAALSRAVLGHAGDIAVATAPQGGVQQNDLPLLAGATQERARQVATTGIAPQAADAVEVSVPLHLPPQVVAGYAEPGTLMIDAGSFGHESAARQRQAALSDVGASLLRTRSGGQTTYAVRAGPYPDTPAADAALARMQADGVVDARIVVDLP